MFPLSCYDVMKIGFCAANKSKQGGEFRLCQWCDVDMVLCVSGGLDLFCSCSTYGTMAEGGGEGPTV